MKTLHSVWASISLAALVACGGGGGGGGGADNTEAPAEISSLSGVSLKGPAVKGSVVTIRPLNDDLTQKGVTYTTQTTNHLGEFSFVGSEPLSRYVELSVNGNYFDEISGGVSSDAVTLRALIDTAAGSRPNVNVITHMQFDRLKKLMAEGVDYAEAERQSLAEVVKAFGATAGADQFKSAYEMSFDGGGDSSAILLAISSQIMQVGHEARSDQGGSITSGLESYMFEFGQDVAADGELDDAGLKDQLLDAAFEMNIDAIKSNVMNYYSDNGSGIIAPNFEEWVDRSGDGGLPHRTEKAVPAFTLNEVVDGNAGVIITSNELTVTGVNAGERVQVELAEVDDDGNGFLRGSYSKDVVPSLFINGKRVKGNDGVSIGSATKDDIIQVQTISPVFNSTVALTLKIGSTIDTWEISTRSPVALYQSENSPAMFYYRDGEQDNFHDLLAGHKKFDAVPLMVETDITAKNLIVDLKYLRSGTPLSFAIYEDLDGVPGEKVFGTLTSFNEIFDREPVKYANSEESIKGLYRIGNNAVFLGDEGFMFNANQKYWLVYERAEDHGQTGDGPLNTETGITMTAAGKPAFGTFMFSNDGESWESHPQYTNFEGTFDIAPIFFLID